VLLVAAAPVPAPSQATRDEANSILKGMTDYIAAQPTLSADTENEIEVITTELQKIQFASSGHFLLRRPDKLRASRLGGYADVDMVFDGRQFSILGKNANAYAQIEAPGTVGQLIDRLRVQSGAAVPAADLIIGTYQDLMDDVTDAKHIGRGVVDGVECEHLAFRTREVDWQIWIALGAKPLPLKYVITTKAVAGAPQYTVRFRNWRTVAQVAADSFTFKPPAGARKVAPETLVVDEVPNGTVVESGR
jgi:hypothetical protein